jgi:hypothetical protein
MSGSEVETARSSGQPLIGADVGAISVFVFGEDEPSLLAKEVEKLIANSTVNWEDVFTRYKDELSLELLASIRARISNRESDPSDT